MACSLTSTSAVLQIGGGKPQRFPIEKLFVSLTATVTRVPERLDNVTQGRHRERRRTRARPAVSLRAFSEGAPRASSCRRRRSRLANLTTMPRAFVLSFGVLLVLSSSRADSAEQGPSHASALRCGGSLAASDQAQSGCRGLLCQRSNAIRPADCTEVGASMCQQKRARDS